MKTFDEGLSEEGIRRAQILRRSIRHDHADYTRPDPPAPGKIECFDDVFQTNSDRARAHELRQKCKAEMWWSQASRPEKKAVMNAVAAAEPYKGNEIHTKHFKAKRPSDLIKVDHVVNYVIKNILGLV